MRKLFVPMFVGLALVGCSSEEDITPGNNGSELGEPQFLTVNLVTTPTNGTRGTRAAGDQHTGDPNDNSTYEEGLDAENKVTKVRFYFFDAGGNAAFVKKVGDDMVNYLEWTNVTEEENNTPNVEKILTAQLIIESPAGDKEPSQIVAIINPMLEPASTERTLGTIATVAHDCKTATTSGKFLMSNSTYAKDNVKQMAVSVADKLKKTSGEALNDPVEIYVERAVAKVRLNSSLTPVEGKTNIFKTSADGSQKVKLDEIIGEQEIYVKFLGWNTTAVSNKSRLVKEINPIWSSNLFGVGSTPWNWSDYCRCFWAINANNVSYEYGAFIPDTESKQIDGNKFQAQAKTKFDGKDWVYVNENASPYASDITTSDGGNASTPTMVIISAQLVDKDGNALEFAEYGSTRTTIDGLKKLFANNCGIYKKNPKDETKFDKITPDELIVKTATAAGETSTSNHKPDIKKPGRYKSYVQLASDEDNKWYTLNAENATPITAQAANDLLKGLGSAKVWKDGYTYYFFDISHFGTKKGVVRNHIYDATITKLTGLGTPVYNPEEIIYPEKPEDSDDTFIAAKINILSWRVVNSNVELDW